LTPAFVGEWPVSRPSRFNPRESVPDTQWIGGCKDTRAGFDDMEKRKISSLPGLELQSLGRPARSQSRNLYHVSHIGIQLNKIKSRTPKLTTRNKNRTEKKEKNRPNPPDDDKLI
jgi:hypothetical protein